MDVISLNEAMTEMEAVIHCAAIISFRKSERRKMYKVNIEGTANVVNMALEKNINRFVHISSVAALGRTVKGDYVNEEKNGRRVRSIPIMPSLNIMQKWKCGVE